MFLSQRPPRLRSEAATSPPFIANPEELSANDTHMISISTGETSLVFRQISVVYGGVGMGWGGDKAHNDTPKNDRK